jgi:glycosyltransferase involved in cell wall biosynthesis
MVQVSCVMATKNRPGFLAQAIAYYLRQTHPSSELIIVDDSSASNEAAIPPIPAIPTVATSPITSRITYVHLPRPTSLGEKLNLGIERASGAIIQKLDDDDFYHPSFLEATSSRLVQCGHPDAVVAMESFLVYLLRRGELVDAGAGWFAGGSFCFQKRMWRRAPFRDVPRRVDVCFLEDHPEAVKAPLSGPELYVVVRHDHHTWTRIVPEVVVPIEDPGGIDVTTYFAGCPRYHKSLAEVIGAEHCAFYEGAASAAEVPAAVGTGRQRVRGIA